MCYFGSGDWYDSIIPECDWTSIYNDTIAFIPNYFRCVQCTRRYFDTKVKINLVNAGKYFTKMVAHLASIFISRGDKYLYLYIGIRSFSTVYSYAWDIYYDWGLLRCSEKGKYGLRPKMKYSNTFYYFAVIANLLCRLYWILPLLDTDTVNWYI